MKKLCSFLIIGAILFSNSIAFANKTKVDLNRYMGLWYELGHVPSFFETKNLSCGSAYYQLINDKTGMAIRNRGYEHGMENTAYGIGWPAKSSVNNDQLKVVFYNPYTFIPGNYYIAYVDSNYQEAIVTSKKCHKAKYIWLMSRTPNYFTFTRLKKKAADMGYNTANIVQTPQINCPRIHS